MTFSRDEMTNILIAQDIISIRDDMTYNDFEFIYAVLRGDGWRQYDNLTIKQLKSEFVDRFDDIKNCAMTLELAHKLNEEPIDLLKEVSGNE